MTATAISLHGPQPAQFDPRQSASSPRMPSSSSPAPPSGRPGPRSRHTPLDMSHFRGQPIEAQAVPGTELPSKLAAAKVPPATNGRRLPESPVPPSDRPSSAPGNEQNQISSFSNRTASEDDEQDSVPARPAKPPLMRSQSEHGLRHDHDEVDRIDEEYYEWGARHGFEDHYQSEDIISQLANVSLIRKPLVVFGYTLPLEDPCVYFREPVSLTKFRTGTCISPTRGTIRLGNRSRLRLRFKTGACETASRLCLRR